MKMRKLKKYKPTKFKAKDSVYDKDAADFAVTKLTAELLDEYVEKIEVHPGDEVRIIWK